MGTLSEFIQKRVREVDSEERRAKANEWIAAVERLLSQFRQWMADADPEGRLQVVPIELVKQERGIGTYTAPGLDVRLIEDNCRIEPVARRIGGAVTYPDAAPMRAEGRVDISDLGRRRTLLRTLRGGSNGTWWMRSTTPAR